MVDRPLPGPHYAGETLKQKCKDEIRMRNYFAIIQQFLSSRTSGGQPVRDQEPQFSMRCFKEPHETSGHTCTKNHLYIVDDCIYSLRF